jgi:rod shape-determining protein MreB
VKGRGVAVNEPSLVTVRTSSGDIEAVGVEAEAGRGRTPRKFQTVRPIRAGIISDSKLFDGMLHRFLRKARIAGPLHRLKVAIAVPSGMTEGERLAVIESIQNAGAVDILLVNHALAAARGAGVWTEESRARLVVDIGAGVTGLAVISLGNCVYARSTRVAGDDLDAAIAAHVRTAHQLVIGERTAERLKIQIGSAISMERELTSRVKGRCAERGIPREVTVRACEVLEAISAPLERITSTIREVLEQAPPEINSGLIETGIVLAGGSALLRNLDRFISKNCGLPVRIAQDPLSCVIRGVAHELNNPRTIDWRRFGDHGVRGTT